MKKILFLFLVFALAMQTSKAQVYDIYIPSGVVLTDNQWHTDGYCIVQAGDDRYLVINPNGYDYYTLQPFDVVDFTTRTGDVALSYKPYVYYNILGWFVEGRSHIYFAYPLGGYRVLSYRPVYYDYYYTFRFLRHLNMRNYYWYRPYYRPRPLPHHGPSYRPGNGHHPGYGRPPQGNHGPGIQNRPPQRNQGSGIQNRPPQRNQGSGVQNRPPQRNQGSGTQIRPSQGNQGRGTQSRPPQRSGNGQRSSGQSRGSSSHRR